MTKIVKKAIATSIAPFNEILGNNDEPAPAAKPKVLPMPDQEEQRRLARRNAASRRSSRTANILTTQEGDKLGG